MYCSVMGTYVFKRETGSSRFYETVPEEKGILLKSEITVSFVPR